MSEASGHRIMAISSLYKYWKTADRRILGSEARLHIPRNLNNALQTWPASAIRCRGSHNKAGSRPAEIHLAAQLLCLSVSSDGYLRSILCDLCLDRKTLLGLDSLRKRINNYEYVSDKLSIWKRDFSRTALERDWTVLGCLPSN